MEKLVSKLVGPIAVLGSTGFIGQNLVNYLKKYRKDVHTASSREMWEMLEKVQPKTVFNCISYGAYNYQQAPSLVFHTNFTLTQHILSWLTTTTADFTYIHAGSSVEYGMAKAYPNEETYLRPATPYAVSKAASSQLVYYYGKTLKKRVANLRLYCVYGPYEKHIHLIPTICIDAIRHKRLPEFVRGDISRDFIYVDDVCRAFITAAANLREANYGESFNIGTGKKTTISQVAEISGRVAGIAEQPKFTMPEREWDTSEEWIAQTYKAKSVLGFESDVSFESGFRNTYQWFVENL